MDFKNCWDRKFNEIRKIIKKKFVEYRIKEWKKEREREYGRKVKRFFVKNYLVGFKFSIFR